MKLPRNFIITAPKVGSVVEVHGVSQRPLRAVVARHADTDTIEVRPLTGQSSILVPWRQCTHGRVR